MKYGQIIVNFGQEVLVHCDDGSVINSANRKSFSKVVVGDHVTVELINKQHVISSILPRNNELKRIDRRNKELTLAANIDIMCIVIAKLPKISLMNIDKYILGAFRKILSLF